ncbi:MAG TPA: UbiA-like polyprenyltransferase [Bacteroidia bacterium]|jgi:4-hydroxybenzoate polyprenyltransferase|nr:UbiA-like polyprenyltransferase [Bacteroidia bacterium]
MKSGAQQVKNYLSLVKFSHTVFALPFALIGFFLALRHTSAPFSGRLFIEVILCMIFARSAAMAFNRYIDRHIDAINPRTARREIPAGVIASTHAFWFVILNSVLFMAVTFFINPICFYLSPIALLIVLGYSYTKRFTALCHIVLGIGLSLAPIGAYLAVTGVFSLLPILYSFTVLFWVSGFDMIYAMQDEDFDRSNKLRSIPAWLGKRNTLILSDVFHVLSALLVISAGLYAGFGIWYWIGTAIFTGLLIYQHLLVKPDDLSRVNLAFMTTNGVASVLFSVFVLIELMLSR